MNENIDVRMSNFITILSNPQLKKEFDLQTIMAMEKALVIYASTTAIKYVEGYENEKKSQEIKDSVHVLS